MLIIFNCSYDYFLCLTEGEMADIDAEVERMARRGMGKKNAFGGARKLPVDWGSSRVGPNAHSFCGQGYLACVPLLSPPNVIVKACQP